MTTHGNSEVQFCLVINNGSGKLSKIVLEPWADEIDVSKGDEISVFASGPASDARIDQESEDDVLIIHARHGWTLTVLLNGQEVATASKVFPSI